VVPFACGSFGGAEAGTLFWPENNMPFGVIEIFFPSVKNKKQLGGGGGPYCRHTDTLRRSSSHH
jgi:hypothetical protein